MCCQGQAMAGCSIHPFKHSRAETMAPGLACSSTLSRSSPYCLLQVWPAKKLRLHDSIMLTKH